MQNSRHKYGKKLLTGMLMDDDLYGDSRQVGWSEAESNLAWWKGECYESSPAFSFIHEHNLRLCVGAEYDFSEIKEACAALDCGKVNGKIVVKMME